MLIKIDRDYGYPLKVETVYYPNNRVEIKVVDGLTFKVLKNIAYSGNDDYNKISDIFNSLNDDYPKSYPKARIIKYEEIENDNKNNFI